MDMDKKDIYMKILIVLVVLSMFFIGKCIFKLKDDNLLEERVEKVIEDEFGVNVDLTPLSSEKS